MNILKKLLTLEEFKKYIKGKDFSPNDPNKLVIHHTWKPVQSDWNGKTTIDGLKKYYEGKGWTAGPHIFVAPDGIWLFTDMKTQGIHAGVGNYRSIGIEVVGNYDGAKWAGSIKRNTLGVIDALMEELDLDYEDIRFHRDYSSKSCPGWAITKEWIIEKLEKMNEPEDNTNETIPAPVEAVSGDNVEIVEEAPIVEPEPFSSVSEPPEEGLKYDYEKQAWVIEKNWLQRLVEKILDIINNWIQK